MTTLRHVAITATDQAGDAIGEVLVSAEALQRRVRELGEEISRDYAGRPLLLIGVLKGAVFFLSDLMRFIDIPVEVDFMAVASYGSATDSSGVVRILKDLDAAIEDRDVVIVEDIVNSGLTLQYLLRNLGSRNPTTLEVCALLTKPERRKVALQAKYVGFEIPDRLSWATAWITPSVIATCRSSRHSSAEPRRLEPKKATAGARSRLCGARAEPATAGKSDPAWYA